MSNPLLGFLSIIGLLVCQCPCILTRGSASFGGSGRRVKYPLEEEDMGMPITHPAVMIPLIGVIIMITVMVCACCLKLMDSGSEKNARKNVAPVEKLQLGRKPRSRSTTPNPQFAVKKNGAKCERQDKKQKNGIINNIELDGLPYDCYKPAVKREPANEQLV